MSVFRRDMCHMDVTLAVESRIRNLSTRSSIVTSCASLAMTEKSLIVSANVEFHTMTSGYRATVA